MEARIWRLDGAEPRIEWIDPPAEISESDQAAIDRQHTRLTSTPQLFDGPQAIALDVLPDGVIRAYAGRYSHYQAIKHDGAGIGAGSIGAGVFIQDLAGRWLWGLRGSWVDDMPDTWKHAPVGGIEPPMTATETAYKEASEELGLVAADFVRLEPLAVVQFADRGRGVMVYFRGVISNDAKPLADGSEILELRWAHDPLTEFAPVNPFIAQLWQMLIAEGLL